ncbi:MAG: fatty acid desaturase [Lysobacteraceae bacterium]|nr:MAG: fatty acid desaturase [Xanthomonadaceae bacterium]
MNQELYTFLTQGLANFSIVQMIVALLIVTSITVWSVTIFLHRCQAHRGLDLHPVVSHFFRFWLWLTTGMETKEWVAIHRKHHARCETAEDPHSPQVYGITKVLFHGVQLYTDERTNKETMEKYGHGTPDDWLERQLYSGRWVLGPTLLLALDIALFGVLGITFWAIQVVWIPLFAAGVINGLGHWSGYRNFHTEDTSTNLTPWGVFLGGEELHNNHHAFPSSARFSMRKWEFDIGWVIIRMLSACGLATIRRVAPQLEVDPNKSTIDPDTLKAVFAHRFTVMRNYYAQVLKPAAAEEMTRAGDSIRGIKRQTLGLLQAEPRFLNRPRQQGLQQLLQESAALSVLYDYRERLKTIWDRSSTDPDALLEQLRQWCREAEASGIRRLEEFAASLRTYTTQTAMA